MECRELKLEKLPQPTRLRSAHRNLRLLLIIHAQLIAALEPRHNFLDVIDIHNIGAMRPPEDRRIEQIEQFFQRSAFRLPFERRRHHGNYAFVDRGETDIFLINEQQAALRLQNDLSAMTLRLLLLLDELEQRSNADIAAQIAMTASMRPGSRIFFLRVDFLQPQPGAFKRLQYTSAVKRLQQI